MTEENNCTYVSSRGILKSCDIHSSSPKSSIHYLHDYQFVNMKDGVVIYVCLPAIPHFIEAVVPLLTIRYILVSGDSDETIPNDILPDISFLDSPYLIHWFSQNCIFIHHPKLSQIPIGLDYHTLSVDSNHAWGPQMTPIEQERELISIKENSLPFWEREPCAYANFHFTNNSPDRAFAIKQISKDLVYYEPTITTRINSWQTQAKYAFVISPFGHGLDCHRTWEAFILGCIPIVKTSSLDSLYKDLPVLIVESWEDITQELLHKTIETYKTRVFHMNRLTLQYWMDEIRSKCI